VDAQNKIEKGACSQLARAVVVSSKKTLRRPGTTFLLEKMADAALVNGVAKAGPPKIKGRFQKALDFMSAPLKQRAVHLFT